MNAMVTHDNAYKNLFSHPQVVRDFLRGYVAEPWVDELDFATLEKASNSYVTDDLRDRSDDMIWRVRHRDAVIYIYLLLEFQRSDDPWMALRILTYVGLLYQDLIKRGEVRSGGRLPAVFPAVIYNGPEPWRSAREVAELIEAVPRTLRPYRPRQRYFLLDERDPPARLPDDNTMSDIIALEQWPDPAQLQAILLRLRGRLDGDQNRELRRALAVWLQRVVLPGLVPGEEMPPVNDLQEVTTMVAQRGLTWPERWKQEGKLEGKLEGKEEGLKEGEARVLLRQLELRFGAVPEDVRAWVAEADADTLLRWSEQVLTAATIEDVLR